VFSITEVHYIYVKNFSKSQFLGLPEGYWLISNTFEADSFGRPTIPTTLVQLPHKDERSEIWSDIRSDTSGRVVRVFESLNDARSYFGIWDDSDEYDYDDEWEMEA